jgi:hypothetical protein
VVGVDVTQEEMERDLAGLALTAHHIARKAGVERVNVSVIRGAYRDYISAYAWDPDAGDGVTCAEYPKEVEREGA